MAKLETPPALALFLLSPMIGELFSGSSPPLEFFNPIIFLLLASLYGSGALVTRELRIRWKKGYSSLFLFGAAYGIAEEGLMVKTFFDPNWIDLGYLGVFGRWMGVNWVWAEMLIIYHAVFSIMIPIVLVELVYPERREQSWVGRRTFAFLVMTLIGVVAFGFFLLTPYQPPAPQYIFALIATTLLVLAGYKLQPKWAQNSKQKKQSGRALFAIGCVGSTTFFLLYWAGSHIIDNAVMIMTLGAFQVFAFAKLLTPFNWKSSAADANLVALCAGALSFPVFLAFLHEFRPDMVGMSVVGAATIIGILLLRRKTKARGQGKQYIEHYGYAIPKAISKAHMSGTRRQGSQAQEGKKSNSLGP